MASPKQTGRKTKRPKGAKQHAGRRMIAVDRKRESEKQRANQTTRPIRP